MAQSRPASGQALKVRLSHIREEGEPYTIALDERELGALLAEAGAYTTAGRGLEASLQLARVNHLVSVAGELETWVQYACSRCTHEATERVKVSLAWQFLPAGKYREKARPDEEVELTAEDMDVSFYEGDEIDLGELIREALLLELPSYPVCQEGCAVELVGARAEADAGIDPRWFPLLDLKRRQRS